MERTDGSFPLYMQYSESSYQPMQWVSLLKHLCTLILTSSTLPLLLPLVKLIPCFYLHGCIKFSLTAS